METGEWANGPAPTHRCRVCGALWRFWRKEETSALQDTWQLQTSVCGPCCDNVPMGEQIEPLSMARLRDYLAALMATDLMKQTLFGPKEGDPIQ